MKNATVKVEKTPDGYFDVFFDSWRICESAEDALLELAHTVDDILEARRFIASDGSDGLR